MSNDPKRGPIDKARKVIGHAGTWRRWVESLVVSFVQWLVRLAAIASWALIVLIVLSVLYWIAARMLGWPLHFRVQANSQELMGVGVFVFCAAYALKART